MVQISDYDLDEALNYSLLRGDMTRIWDSTNTDKNINNVAPHLVEREKDRINRSQLNSADGNTREIHDQFYRDHKLLLILFRVLAVMPIIRSAPGTVTFSWKSSATAYAVGFYILTSVIVVIVGYERLQILQTTRKFDDYIYAIIFVIFLVPHFWIPFVGWGVANHVAAYKTMWATFQVRYFRVTGNSLQFPHLKTLIIVISIGCLLCAILFLLSLTVLLDGFLLWHTSAYYHIVTMINMNSALWYINCRGIKEASRSLSESFKRVL